MPNMPKTAEEPESLPNIGINTEEIDAVKGFLILLVVIGHNVTVTRPFPWVFDSLYYFHVFCFFLLPFFYPEKRLSWAFVKSRAFRYLAPFTLFYLLSSSLYFALFVSAEQKSHWMMQFLIAPFVASANALKDACGLQAYFFLPALFSLNLVKASYTIFPKHGRAIILLFFAILHVFIGELPLKAKYWLPFGLAVAIYVFPIGILFTELNTSLRRFKNTIPYVLSICIGIVLMDIALKEGNNVNLAILQIYGVSHPIKMLLHDMIPVLSLVGILWAAPYLSKLPGLIELGKHSLIIYLAHSLVLNALLLGINKLFSGIDFSRPHYLIMLFTLTLSLISSYLLSLIISRTKLRHIVTPRG